MILKFLRVFLLLLDSAFLIIIFTMASTLSNSMIGYFYEFDDKDNKSYLIDIFQRYWILVAGN